MERYRLISAVTIPTDVDVRWMTGGQRHYGFVRLVPGKEYEVPEDDPVLRESLIGATTTVTYTESFEEKLKECGANYQVVPPSCRCRKKPNIVFNSVEVYEV